MQKQESRGQSVWALGSPQQFFTMEQNVSIREVPWGSQNSDVNVSSLEPGCSLYATLGIWFSDYRINGAGKESSLLTWRAEPRWQASHEGSDIDSLRVWGAELSQLALNSGPWL